MKPVYDHAEIQIYHGDCRDILLPKVDLVLTDPPYGHGKRWSGGTWATNPIYEDAFRWDAEKVENELLLEVIEKGNYAIIWGGNYYILPSSRCWLAWEKSSKMPTMADFELAWTNFDKPSKMLRENRNPDGKRQHPTQKPLSLIKWCIELYGNNNTILDPFMGSGTTLVAAKQLGRKAIGVEIEEKYVEIAINRLSQEVLPWGRL